MLVSGALASGKTELLHAFCDHVADSGGLLLTATGARSESGVQMGVLSQLVHSAPLPPEITDRVAAAAAASEAGAPETGAPLVPSARRPEIGLIRDFCATLLELSKERAVVIAIDDLHFVDQASVQALLYLRLRMRSARILLISTEWTQPWATPSSLRVELTRLPHHRIMLSALSQSSVGELLAQHLGAPVAAQSAATYHQLTAGNPMLVRALIEDNVAFMVRGGDGGPVTEPVVGVAFGQAVLSCLHRWELGLVDIAQGVAVLGAHATPALVSRLLDVEPDAVVRGIGILTEAGLLGAGRFRHAAAGAAVLDSLAATDASRLHLRAAELLYQQGAATVEVARHIVAADDVGGPWAVPLLREAGRQAMMDDEVQLAAQCLLLALRACDDERERVSITAELATVRWRVNPSAAIRLTPLRGALFEGELSGRDAATVVRNLLWQGDHEEAVKALTVLHGPKGVLDPQTGAELDLAYQWIYGPRRARVPRQAVGDHHRAGAAANPWTRAASALTAALHDRTRDDLVDSAWHLLRSSRLSDTSLEVLANALLTLTYADQPDCAASWCDNLLAEAVRRRVPTWQAVLGSVRADIALHQGDLPAAKAWGRTALEKLPAQSGGVLIGYPLSTLVLAATAMGDYDEASALLQHAVPEKMFETVFGLRYLHARGHLYLETDRVLAAFTDFQNCGSLMRKWDIDVPVMVPWRSDLAQAHLRLGHLPVARDLVTKQLEQPSAIGSRVWGISLRVLAASGDVKQRPQLLRDAIDRLRASGDRLELAKAMADLSQAYHEIGESGRARKMAHRAREEAEVCQANVLSEQLRESGGRAAQGERSEQQADLDGMSVLSDAERRVASQAALGYTNREIGLRLFITPSTVEQHLTRVYRKLKVNGRRHLPPELLLQGVTEEARQKQPS